MSKYSVRKPITVLMGMLIIIVLGIFGLIAKITGNDIRPNLVGTPWSFYLPSLLGVGIKGGLFTINKYSSS